MTLGEDQCRWDWLPGTVSDRERPRTKINDSGDDKIEFASSSFESRSLRQVLRHSMVVPSFQDLGSCCTSSSLFLASSQVKLPERQPRDHPPWACLIPSCFVSDGIWKSGAQPILQAAPARSGTWQVHDSAPSFHPTSVSRRSASLGRPVEAC